LLKSEIIAHIEPETNTSFIALSLIITLTKKTKLKSVAMYSFAQSENVFFQQANSKNIEN